MTKQQLTRLFIVIAIIAAVVFVPYWVAIFSIKITGVDKHDHIAKVWIVGALMIVFTIMVAKIITMSGNLILIGLKFIFKPIINYIKNGK